jgi:hypothetical protein
MHGRSSEVKASERVTEGEMFSRILTGAGSMTNAGSGTTLIIF